jgi:hypothetical protein
MSDIEEIKAFSFMYVPFDRTCPIRSCELIIYAKDRKEAELLALDNNWKFFNLDHSVVVTEKPFSGYRRKHEGSSKESSGR